MWKVTFFFESIVRYLYRATWKLFHLNLYKDPQLYIPKNTLYCYKFNGSNGMKEQYANSKKVILPYYGTDNCVFHKNLWNKRQHDLCMLDGSDCLMDFCKTCGINENCDKIMVLCEGGNV